MKVRTSLIGLLVVCGIGVCGIGTAAAQPAGPPAGYNINPEVINQASEVVMTFKVVNIIAKRSPAPTR
jgi:hypothetical protein